MSHTSEPSGPASQAAVVDCSQLNSTTLAETMTAPQPPNSQLSNHKTISGSKLVLAMFGLAITATSILWFYWDMHLMPYMPLQEALATEFKDSSPRVDGGQRKIHKGTPMILRVVMRVPFDPTSSDIDIQNQIESRIARTKELAISHTEIDKFQTLEVHMYFQPKEKTIKQKTFEKSLETSEPSV